MTASKKKTKEELFVDYVLTKIRGDNQRGTPPDTGFRACMRKAQNPDTEYQSWEYLSRWCDLENPRERMAFATVGASLAEVVQNGRLGIGQALAMSYSEGSGDGREHDGAKSKLRRLLNCDDAAEACSIMRPILRLAASRGVVVDYTRLLRQLRFFGEKVKLQWATDFYGKPQNEKEKMGGLKDG